MSYSNRRPPEGINTSKDDPWVADFLLLLVGFFLTMAMLVWLLLKLISFSAGWIPVAWESAIVDPFLDIETRTETHDHLQKLAEQLAIAGGFDMNAPIKARLSDNSMANAYATLGGHVVIMQGLLDAVETEQGLAFVLAHELAHLHYRHPVKALSQQLGLATFMEMVFGRSDLIQLVGTGGQLLQLDYSRDYERQADAWALQAMASYYGHIQGFDEFFQWVIAEDDRDVPEWMHTHPDTQQRITRLLELTEKERWSRTGKTTPLESLFETKK